MEAVKERFTDISSTLGADPRAGATTHGPVADEAQFKNVMSYIDLGKEFSAPVVGGHRKGDKGFFIEPTLFVNPDRHGRMFKEEIFGPVLSIVTFKTEEEAIEMANETVTGLSGMPFSSIQGDSV
jgi:aldehyde dehydrogenase (NAD+)